MYIHLYRRSGDKANLQSSYNIHSHPMGSKDVHVLVTALGGLCCFALLFV